MNQNDIGGPCCACLDVRYDPERDGLINRERWRCKDCGTEFVKKVIAESENARLRAALRDIYDARLAGDWVTEPLQWCAEVAKRALQLQAAIAALDTAEQRGETTDVET